MIQNRALSWERHNTRGTALMAVIALVASLFISAAGPAAAAPEGTLDLIVRETSPASETAETLVERLGGVVTANLDIIGGFSASVPAGALDVLRVSDAILTVTADHAATDLGAGWQDATLLGDYDPNEWMGSMLHMGHQLGVDEYWSKGYTGAGVGIALIDTGVVPVEGLTAPGKIVNGPDLSFESQSDTFRHLDTYGHGTHLAGIIAGRDSSAPAELDVFDAAAHHLGAAPDAHIVNVKVAGHDGAVDVSQVIAALDWVVQHKDDHNIRIINLSYGTDSTQDPRYDPLSYAVEQAWKHGLLVVVASGNDGNTSAVRNPATNPYVLTVGALDGYSLKGKNTQPIPDWSSCGTDRTVDLVAPGTSIVSLRNPGSTADVEHPEARVGDRFFLGSGTSQAAAAASGAAALVLERNPEYTPDQLKDVLIDSADSFRRVSSVCQGAGKIRLHDTWWETPDQYVQSHPTAFGTGSLEDARGSDHLEIDGVVLEGEQDIFGVAWDGELWSVMAALGTSWSGGDWNGTSWSGTSWSGTSWSGTSWSGTSWSGTSWSGTSWSGTSWSDKSWSGTSWSGTSWSGTS
ncbi:MAG: S8 family serine peptidase, partial [Acidimicrobiia bacterium]|nr:S8 family serine peptidase [Acidimicrobiia bacterium]